MLIARRPILYEGREFRTGEALPENDDITTKKWVNSGAAELKKSKEPSRGAKKQEVK